MKLERIFTDKPSSSSSGQEIYHLVLSYEELKLLDTVLKAGIITGPVIRNVPQDTTEDLSTIIANIRESASTEHTYVELTKNDIWHLDMITSAVNTLDIELYYDNLEEPLPSDEALNKFALNIEKICAQVFCRPQRNRSFN